MKSFFQGLAKNWKTSLAGIVMLAMTGFQIYQNPALVTDPTTDTKIAGAVGLLVAGDAKTPAPPSGETPAGK